MQHNTPTCTKHNTCRRLAKENAAHSAAVAPILYYQNNKDTHVIGVGRETGGQYAGEFNLCAGKGEAADNNAAGEFCFLNCAVREFYEEFGINAQFAGGVFDSFFKDKNGKIRVFVFKRTPIFVAVLPAGTSRMQFNARMQANINNPNLPHAYKEMDAFEYIRLDNGQQIDGKPIRVSSFANAVLKVIDVNKL